MYHYHFYKGRSITLNIINKPVAQVPGSLLFCRHPENVGLNELKRLRTRSLAFSSPNAVTEYEDPEERWAQAFAVRLPWKKKSKSAFRETYVFEAHSRLQWYLCRLIPNPFDYQNIHVVMTPLGWREPEMVVLSMLAAITDHAHELTTLNRKRPQLSYSIAAQEDASLFADCLRSGALSNYRDAYLGCKPARTDDWKRPWRLDEHLES